MSIIMISVCPRRRTEISEAARTAGFAPRERLGDRIRGQTGARGRPDQAPDGGGLPLHAATRGY